MRTFVTVAGSVLLTVSCVTASDARQHARQQSPTQSQTIYNNSDYNNTRNRDIPAFILPVFPNCMLAPQTAAERRTSTAP